VTVLVEAFGDVAADSYAAEAGAVRHAELERRREHASVRACARSAMSRLGQRPTPILNDADGVPVWPAGVVGSLTHCRGYRAALVALSTAMVSVGVDAEPHEPLPPEVDGVVLGPDDRDDLLSGWHAGRIAFCAKEAAYKTWFPGTRRWLEFTDVVTHVRSDGTFTARVDGLPALRGRWAIRRGYVVATGLIPC
jgi:4'-phosphopantetheinyl transferase EntD